MFPLSRKYRFIDIPLLPRQGEKGAGRPDEGECMINTPSPALRAPSPASGRGENTLQPIFMQQRPGGRGEKTA